MPQVNVMKRPPPIQQPDPGIGERLRQAREDMEIRRMREAASRATEGVRLAMVRRRPRHGEENEEYSKLVRVVTLW